MHLHDQPSAVHLVQLRRPLSEQLIAWGCALASIGKFTTTSLRRPTNETWDLAEKLGLTVIDRRPFFPVCFLQPGDEILNQSRAMALQDLVSSMSDEERAPYLVLATAAHEPGQSGEGSEP